MLVVRLPISGIPARSLRDWNDTLVEMASNLVPSIVIVLLKGAAIVHYLLLLTLWSSVIIQITSGRLSPKPHETSEKLADSAHHGRRRWQGARFLLRSDGRRRFGLLRRA